MNKDTLGIEEPSPVSDQDRRWTILRWLSVKLRDEPHGEILSAASRFEEFVANQVAGQKLSEEAISKIKRIEPAAGEIVAAASEEADIPEWMDRR